MSAATVLDVWRGRIARVHARHALGGSAGLQPGDGFSPGNGASAPARALHRWLKFNFVGAVGIGVQLAALSGLRVLGLHYLLATALAVETAVLHNFIWHERFTWADRASLGLRQAVVRLLRFNLTTGLVSIGGNLLLMRLFVGELHLKPVLANLITIAACGMANFLVSDRVVFRPAWWR